MTKFGNLREIIEKIEIEFRPVIDINKKEVYGYKVVKILPKEFNSNKRELYDWMHKEGCFEFFIWKLKDKSLKEAKRKGILDKKFFYTLRANYIEDKKFLFSNIDKMIEKYSLNKENICFEVKGFDSWQEIEGILDYVEDGYDILIKEETNKELDINLLHLIEPQMIELKNLNDKLIKEIKEYNGRLVYKLKPNEEVKDLRKRGIDFIYEKN